MKYPSNSIAVFCGSSAGHDAIYSQLAIELADCLIQRDMTLVYGGATVGLMGILADRMLSQSGRVIGVMPQSLVDKEIAHHGLTKLYIVNSMHERKALISDISQAFVMLPGGAGSLDEFFEMYTWAQLGYHQKPCAILNVNHYYDDLLRFLDKTVEEGFVRAVHRNMVLVDDSPSGLLKQMDAYEAPTYTKWIKRSETL